jgi:D-alanyl-D-alanine carboxypeptidase
MQITKRFPKQVYLVLTIVLLVVLALVFAPKIGQLFAGVSGLLPGSNSNRSSAVTDTANMDAGAKNPQQLTGSAMASQLDSAAFNSPTDVANLQDFGYLQLINSNFGITSSPDPGMLADVPADLTAYGERFALHEQALSAVSEFLAAADSAGFSDLVVNSAHRSAGEQAALYNDAADKSFVQPVGHSEHQSGLAADIVIPYLNSATTTSGACAYERWMAENSWRYGLALRYPESKEHTTGISYEPWHFRYVGTVHASYMYQNDLCLEEYIEALALSGGFQIELGETKYCVSYQLPKDGIIYVPDNLQHAVSSVGNGAYIVTAWE